MGLPQIGFLGVVLLRLAAAPAEAAPARLITILHTGDLHGHVESWIGWEGELEGKRIGGFDRLANAIGHVRKKVGKERVLLLDSGDTFGDTLLADLTQGSAIVSLMNHVGYDAMALGNHEFDFGVAVLRQREQQARFPLLAANVIERSTGRPLTKPYILRDIGGLRIAILGLGYPNTALTTAAKNVDSLSFEDAVATAADYVPALRHDGAGLVIVLCHLGLRAETMLAESVPGIDVILGGHSHNRMTKALRVNETLIVQSGAHGSDLGRLDLTIKDAHIVAYKRTLVMLDNAVIPSDPEVARELDALVRPHRAESSEPIGELSRSLARAQTLAGQDARKRKDESPADDLLADIIRSETATDIALLPGVGYGVALPKGDITAAALRNLVPHHSKVVTMTLTGAQVRDILEQAVQNVFTDDSKEKVGGMVQVSGLTFDYDETRPRGQRILAISVGEAALSLEQRYRVATNSLLAEGGHRYDAFLSGEGREEHAEQYEILKHWFIRHKTVEPPNLGRIRERK